MGELGRLTLFSGHFYKWDRNSDGAISSAWGMKHSFRTHILFLSPLWEEWRACSWEEGRKKRVRAFSFSMPVPVPVAIPMHSFYSLEEECVVVSVREHKFSRRNLLWKG